MIAALANKSTLKWILYGAGALLVFVLLAFVYQWVKKLMAQSRAEATVSVNVSNLTISENEAVIIADRIENAMQGVGTANASIIDSLKALQTPDDFGLLLQKFGVRDNCTAFGLGCESGNLIDWLQWEFYGAGSYEPGGFGFASGLYWQQQLENELTRLGIDFEAP